MKGKKYISIDIGAVSVKAAASDDRGNLSLLCSQRIEGNFPDCVRRILVDLNHACGPDNGFICAVTGSGARNLAYLMGLDTVDEATATYLGGIYLAPGAGSILSVGGLKACFIRLMDDPATGRRMLKNSIHNSRCSSGCGIFIEQEAGRCNLSLEQMIELARESTNPPSISGRCTVFAKTDIIHRHQNGVPLKDIAGAVCRMVARNLAGELIKKSAFELPLVFVGGVARNDTVRAELRRILHIDDNSLIVPSLHLYAGAIGAYRHFISKNGTVLCNIRDALEKVDRVYRVMPGEVRRLTPLVRPAGSPSCVKRASDGAGKPGDYFLGIDVGSTNTKVVCIDGSGRLLESYSTATKGQPLEAVREAFGRMGMARNGAVPRAVGVTGSGRKYISDIIRGDIAVNEITAHAEAALSFDPEIDTVIDIGGQDAKFIKITNGRVTGFEMNKVCSAGTGSFLEETAGFLGLDVRDSFAEKAFEAAAPLDLGDRCTVFMNLELAHRQNQGFPVSDIAAGLACSVINNYMSRVVGRHKTGRNISFQGGVAGNQAVVAALERNLDRQVFVHPFHEIAGAFGAAIIAGKAVRVSSRFAGYEAVRRITVNHESFQCRKCGNACSVNYVVTDNSRRLYFGGVCDRYDEGIVKPEAENSSPIAIRRALLEHHSRTGEDEVSSDTIGLPLAMHFAELLPFWTTFLKHLGIKFMVSPATTRETLQMGSDISPSGSCLPLKIAYGHCLYLYKSGIRRLLVPSLANVLFNTRAERLNHICPAAQAWPYTATSLLPEDIDIIDPTVRMALPRWFRSDMIRLGNSLGYGKRRSTEAFEAALDAQHETYRALKKAGTEIISRSDDAAAVIFARPYTFSDYQVHSRLQAILNNLGVTAIPFDMLPAAPRYSYELDGMYWYFGKRYLQAAATMRRFRNPVGIFISTYGCGTDTMIVHMLRDAMGEIPFLELEIDQHCDFTGLRTRLEAFFYSLRQTSCCNVNPVRRRRDSAEDIRGRRIVIPRMSDHAVVCAGALKSFGYGAEVMPLTGERAMSYGKCVVNGGECLPCAMLAGDMLNYLETNHRQEPVAFFMISGDGPCRLGQYTYVLRKILDEKGYEGTPIIDMSQDISFYSRMDIVSSKFKRLLWKGSVAMDLLHARYRALRCLTDDRDGLDKIYRESVERIGDSVDADDELIRQMRSSFIMLDTFGSHGGNQDVTIALIGENYIRCNPAANQRIIERLEDSGVAVCLPHLTEWIYYTNWTARLHCLYEKKYIRYGQMHLIDGLQKLHAYRLRRAVNDRLLDMSEPGVKRLFALASSYVPPTFEGETIISVGRTIDYFLKGIDGVIQVAPFGCMAGTVYETLSERLSADLNGFPILNLQFDGREDELRQEELDCFLVMARNWKEMKEGRR